MFLRLLLILTLLVQQFPLLGAITSAPPADCVPSGCCQLVETTTCCGETILEHRCGKTGGECLCGHQPGESNPTPPAPRPRDHQDQNPVLAASSGVIHDLPTRAQTQRRLTDPVVRRTHNETQALLCIWRT